MNRFLSFMRSRWLPLSILLAAVVLDVISKQLVVAYLKPIKTLPIIEGIFHFTYAENPGAAWSLFSAPDQRWIFMSISSVAIVLMLAYLFVVKIDSPLLRAGLGAVVGGGIGNMIDRISLGYVVDFLDARFINFPIFNVADCFVTIGAGLLFVGLLIDWRREELSARAKKEAERDNASDH